MRKIVMALAGLFLALTAHAGPKKIKHVLTAAPRAVGRTAENMVTFKDRNLALHQWILVAAIMANAGSDVDLYNRCQNCHELDSAFFGLHPSTGRLIGEELVGAMLFSTVQQAAWEFSSGERASEWRVLGRWVPTVFPVLAYSAVSYRNSAVPSDGSRTVRFWQFP